MTTFSDDFLRANETPLGAPWIEVGIVGREMNLSSNHVVPADLTIDCSYGCGGTFANDQAAYADLTVTSTTAADGPGVAVRCGGLHSQNFYQLTASHAASNNVEVRRILADTHTVLLTLTQAWTDGDRWGLKVTGPQTASVLEAYYQGALIGSFTDNSTLASGTPGIGYLGTTSAATIDNFTGTDVFGQVLLPDADLAAGGWGTSPLWSKWNDSSDATLGTATAS